MSKLEQMLSKNHPDVDYLRQADISLVLSKGLAETFKAQPLEPRKYFAKYLLNYAEQQRKENDRKEKVEQVAMKKVEHEKQLQRVEKKKSDKVKADTAEVEKKKAFFESLEKSSDLADNLQSLTDFVKEYTGATGAYIGVLDYPSLKIQEDSSRDAHLDYEADQVLKFKWASSDHEFMIGEVLYPQKNQWQLTSGVTHDVFLFEREQENPEAAEEEEPVEKDILESFKHVYVKEVVREKRMNFTRVPRLGSYMAIPLIYNSCMTDEALEEAVKDFQEVATRQADQDVARDQFDQEQQQKQADAAAAGTEFVASEREWEVIQHAPYKTEERKYVVCLDTMGQDRQFTDQEKRFALETVQRYIEIWEKSEQSNLTADRDRRIELVSGEAADPEQDAEAVTEFQEKAENFVWKKNDSDKIYFNRHVTEEEYVPDEELIQIENKYKYLSIIANRFKDSKEWNGFIDNLKEYRVMRYPQIFQALLFFTDFEREEICLPETNYLSWKITRELKTERIVNAMVDYQMYGETKGRRECKAYQTIPYVEGVLTGLVQEDIDAYHVGLGKLFKWLQTAISGRKQDIVRRKSLQQKAREVRAGKIQEAEDRKKAREEFIVEAEEKWKEDTAGQLEAYERYIQRKAKIEAGDELNEEEAEEEAAEQDDENFEAPVKPVWDPKESFAEFDESNPEIEIPAEVIAHIDSDWPMEEEEENALVDAYWQAKES